MQPEHSSSTSLLANENGNKNNYNNNNNNKTSETTTTTTTKQYYYSIGNPRSKNNMYQRFDDMTATEEDGTDYSSYMVDNDDRQQQLKSERNGNVVDNDDEATEAMLDDTATTIGEEKMSFWTKLSTSLSVCFNLMNTTVGAGILSLPFAFHEAGMVGGPIMLLVVSILSCYTLFILMDCADKVQKFSYKELAKATIPFRFMGHIMEAVLFFFCLSGLVGYCFLIGQFLELQMKDWLLRKSPGGFESQTTVIFSNRSLVMGIPMVFIIFPLCCLRKIKFLSYTSFYSIICALFVIGVVVVRSIISSTKKEFGEGKVHMIGSIDSLFIAFPIICFSMASHITLLPMYSTMKNRVLRVPGLPKKLGSFKLMKVLTVVCMAACFSFYLMIGVFGYSRFRSETVDNILNNYPANDPLNIVAKFAIVLVVIFSFPLLHFACREALENLFFPNRPITTFRWITEACIICGLVFGMAAIVPDLQTAFGIAGATAGTLVVYTFPAFMYLMVTESLLQKVIAVLVMICSIVMGCASTVVLIIDAVRDHIPITSL